VLTDEGIRELVSYDPTTGHFYWLVNRRGQARMGNRAGHQSHGYLVIKLCGKRVQAHRLAWRLVHGKWPTLDIDHINGDRADNRIANLREVPRAVNLQNRRSAHTRSLSGLLGVKKNHNGWSAAITTHGKTVRLGTFKTPIEAHTAYIAAKRQLHEGNTL
jgi:hypothetical protein